MEFDVNTVVEVLDAPEELGELATLLDVSIIGFEVIDDLDEDVEDQTESSNSHQKDRTGDQSFVIGSRCHVSEANGGQCGI